MSIPYSRLLITFLAIVAYSCQDNPLQSKTPVEEQPKTKELPAPSPPMGWNSWNWFGRHTINEQVVVEVIDAIVESGLRDAGYNYVVVDGGWRDPKLGPSGELLPHPQKFPNGIKPLADYAHSKGLKFGLHTVPGTHDCLGDPVGGYGHEEIQIQQLADWGVDFVKLDKCRFEGGWTEETLKNTYFKWSKLLREKSDDVVILSISAYLWRDWFPEVGQMARTTEDISAKVAGMSGCIAVFDDPIPEEINKWNMVNVMQVAEINNEWAKFAGKGYWNDPDMLVTGEHGLSNDEQKSHFALWCIMSAPLMLGNDPRNMTPEEEAIILNEAAIAINQDSTEQGKRIRTKGETEIWAKKLANEDVAILLLNRSRHHMKIITLDLDILGMQSEVHVEDVYAKKELGKAKGTISYEISPKSSLFLKLSQ